MDKTHNKSAAGRPDARISDRQQDILESAALLFAERGYVATSIRDIGTKVGLRGGSLYYYIDSKEALYIRIHNAALKRAEGRIRSAMDGLDEPWQRLEAACRTLLELQVDPSSITIPLMHDLQSVPPGVREQMIAGRDAFEALFIALIDDLPLPERLDRATYRIFLLSLINNAHSWYREGRLSVQDIATQMLAVFRHDAEG
ncbi:TetR/AcrR family transcriptional regulator [Devosia sp. A449]